MHLLHLSLRISVVGYRTHPPQPRPCNHTHQSGRSHTGVRQHDTTGKLRSVRLGRVASTNEAVMAVSCDICSTTRGRSAPAPGPLPDCPPQNSPIQKTGIHPAADHRGPHQTLQSSAIPVTRPNRLDTVSDGLDCCLSRSFQSRCHQSGTPHTTPLPGDRLPFFIQLITEKIPSPPCTVRSISQSTTRGDCSA